MHLKTYTGSSTQEILAKIKEELGPDAVILSNRTVRKDGERLYEVTAGVERNVPPVDTAPAAGASKAAANFAYATAGHLGQEGAKRIKEKDEDAILSPSQLVKQMASNYIQESQKNDESPAYSQNSAGWADWHKEWLQIKDHLFALMKPSLQMERLSPRQRVALEYLQREGVSDAVIIELYRRLLASPEDSVLQSLSEIVPIVPWGGMAWEQRLHCFAGPFGVGKTTTALRMALLLRAQNPSCRIAFINADCLRGNGRLVLRHWAELSDFGYVEAQGIDSMKKALVAHAGADKIFVDLPSLRVQNLTYDRQENDFSLQDQYAQLGIVGNSAGTKATHLVLSPTYDGTQLLSFLNRYAPDGAASIVWSKLDESISFGSIVNAAAACHLPISALSYGAELRDTLSVAADSLLWRLIFKRQLPSANNAQQTQVTKQKRSSKGA